MQRQKITAVFVLFVSKIMCLESSYLSQGEKIDYDVMTSHDLGYTHLNG